MYYKRKLIVGSPIVKHVVKIAKAKIQFFKWQLRQKTHWKVLSNEKISGLKVLSIDQTIHADICIKICIGLILLEA